MFIDTYKEILRGPDALNSRARYESSVIRFNPRTIKEYFLVVVLFDSCYEVRHALKAELVVGSFLGVHFR